MSKTRRRGGRRHLTEGPSCGCGERGAGARGGLAHRVWLTLYNHSGFVAAALGMAAAVFLVLFSGETIAAMAAGVGAAALIAGILAILHDIQHHDWGHLVIDVSALIPGIGSIRSWLKAFGLAREVEELGAAV